MDSSLFVAIGFTGIFILQVILSLLFGDLDTDLDIDGNGTGDVSIPGLIFLKGFLHFGIGFFWSFWLMRDFPELIRLLISVGIGGFTVLILFFTYRLIMKLKNEITPEKGKDLVGRGAEIHYPGIEDNEWVVLTEINGSRRSISAFSKDLKSYESGNEVIIIEYKDEKYWIP